MVEKFEEKFHLRYILCPICPILELDAFYKIKLSTIPCIIPFIYHSSSVSLFFTHLYIYY